MKNRFIIVISAMALTVALAVGISYAWFTDQAQAKPTGVEAGYLDISLESDPITSDNIFPAEDGKKIEYTIKNLSDREVIVQFKLGTLTAYVMPDSYLDDDKYIIKDYRKLIQANDYSDFEKLDVVPEDYATFKIVDGWKFSNAGSDCLGKDIKGNYYLLISEGDTAKGVFEIALTEDAGNKYQYALFTLGEATALATQNNEAAIASAYEGLDIKTLSQP